MNIKTHKFGKMVYDVVIEKLDGLATHDNNAPAMVVTFGPENTKKFLESVIHEAMHCSLPALNEEQVTQSARDIARLLWRLGYEITI